jgi:hypothetical protein
VRFSKFSSNQNHHSPIVRDRALILDQFSLNKVKGVLIYGVSLPKHGKGGDTLQKFPKNRRFSSKKCVYGLEMMGLFLQYDLGIMENVLLWFQGVKPHINT